MANPFDEIILEGFICPKCMLTFGTPDLLSQHFKVEHQNIIIPENGECFPLNKSGLKTQSDASNSFAFYNRKNEVQPLGMCHSLTSKFIELRKNHVNCSSLETNCLLIRLEKLIDVSETNESDRKAFEQAVVPWIDAKVDLCPSCGKPFGLGAEMTFPNEEDEYLDSSESNTSIYRFWPSKSNVARLTNAILDYNPVYRRRHHCRLCGYILCADCSYFISIHNARNLLNALNGQDSDIFQVSLNAADPNSQPNSGEQKYTLESARSMHSDLLQALQKIETLGRQFAEYGEPDSELYVNRVVARLALAVYRRARHFVQNYLPPLQTLPTLKQYVNLTSQRKDELAVRWSEEDKALAELMELVSGKQNFAKMDPSTNPTTKRWQRFFQLPISTSNTYDKRQGKKTTIEYLDSIANKMDLVAGQLMTARQEGQLQIAEELAQELHQLEQEFQKTSSSLNDTESPTL
ncbi:Rabenosyn-5 [Schistosoma japonicum]|nr:Rabenosyn-5 [Schistosoma japonicum]